MLMETLTTGQPHIYIIVYSVGITGDLSHPVLGLHDVTFGYSPDAILYKQLDFGLDLKSRIALVCCELMSLLTGAHETTF